MTADARTPDDRSSRDPALTDGTPPGSTASAGAWHPAWAWMLGAAVVATVLLVFASPIQDADLWWHLAYARDMIAKGTLVPDHTAYSWTPAGGGHIYCTWLSDLVLYGLYRAGGLPVLFVLRYAVLLLMPGFVWMLARRWGLARRPLTYLVMMLTVLMGLSAGIVKPSLFSVVYMTGAVLIWMQVRSGSARAWAWCYAWPPLVLLWVNSHGCFMFGMVFLVLVGVGELLNVLFASEDALPRRTLRHLLAALALAGLVVVATPYGIAYPLDLIEAVTTSSATHRVTVREYDTIFAFDQQSQHYVDTLVVATFVLVLLVAPRLRRRRVNWAFVLTNLAFAVLYVRFVRMTMFWAPIFAVTALDLMRDRPPVGLAGRAAVRYAALAATVVLSLFLGGRAVYQHVTRPRLCQWFGFGNSYINPEEEAEFIDAAFRGRRLGNDYNAGGYLLWRLTPATKVFIDPRRFPYADWYDRYRALETTKGIDAFVDRQACDLWCVILPLRRTISWFCRSSEWKPVFYGNSAAVFVRRDGPYGRMELTRAANAGRVHNLLQGIFVLNFAASVGDDAGFDIVDARLQERFTHSRDRGALEKARFVLRGIRAIRRRDYDEAVGLLLRARDRGASAGEWRPPLRKCYRILLARAWERGDRARALEYADAALAADPADVIMHYNAGAIGWCLVRDAQGRPRPPGVPASLLLGSAGQWRVHLERFVRNASRTPRISGRLVESARNMLDGKQVGTPPIVVPKGR
jgi:hypothetical protein